MEALLDSRQVAEILGVKVGYVIDHASGKREPKIPSIALGRLRKFRAADIERYVEQQRDSGRE